MCTYVLKDHCRDAVWLTPFVDVQEFENLSVHKLCYTIFKQWALTLRYDRLWLLIS